MSDSSVKIEGSANQPFPPPPCAGTNPTFVHPTQLIWKLAQLETTGLYSTMFSTIGTPPVTSIV